MGKAWRNRLSNQSHPDYRHPFHINFLRLAENRTDPSSQETESPMKLYSDSDGSYPQQVMQKGLAHILFCGCVQFTLCFSISAKADSSVCLFDSHAALRLPVHIGSDFLSRRGNITVRRFLTLFFSWGHLSADTSRADIKIRENLPKKFDRQSFLGLFVFFG